MDPSITPYTIPLTIACRDEDPDDVPAETKRVRAGLRSANPDRKSYGGDFVDRNLKIIMRNAPGTLWCFIPSHVHGTTALWRKQTVGITVTFSSHINVALQKAREAEDGVSVEREGGLLSSGNFEETLKHYFEKLAKGR